MSNDIHLDAVADGIPAKYTRLEAAFIVAMLALAAWDAYRGAWGETVDGVLFATLVYLAMRQRREYWVSGYHAAAESMAEQMDSGGVQVDD